MNISIVTQWFPPEHAPIGYMLKELAEELACQGHHVTVITGFPNHPGGVLFPGYTKSWRHEELLGNVRVVRTWLFTSPARSFLSRVLTFLTFTVTSSLSVFRHPGPDLIFAVFQPLTLGLTLPVVAKLRGSRLVLNVQDLHPDALVTTGVLTNRGAIALLRRLETFGYRRARALVVICDGFRDHVVRHGARSDRVAVIGNWIDTEAVAPGDRNNAVRSELGGTSDSFIALYAGTIGHASGAEVVVDAARLLHEEPAIRIAFVGDGPLVPILKTRAESFALRNLAFLPFQPRERLSLVQACCDVAIVSLRPGQGRLSIPSKVLGYMAAARAVIASVDEDSETARLIERAGCGVVVRPGDAQALAGAIRTLWTDPRRLAQLGYRGREYAVKHCAKRSVTQKYAEFLSAVATW
jgi:colanic acid biosynthesis glycosyl transferase WcaI